MPYFISYLTDTQGAIGPTFQFTSSSGSAQTASDGLDDAGDVIGVLYSYPQLPNIPLGGVFLRSASGGFTLLPLPAGLSFAAGLAISGNGSIVISGRQSLFFRMKDGSYTSVPVPGAGVASNAATLTGIDNAGNVVGVIFGDINTSSFFRDDSGNVTVQGAGRQNNAGHGSKQLAV